MMSEKPFHLQHRGQPIDLSVSGHTGELCVRLEGEEIPVTVLLQGQGNTVLRVGDRIITGSCHASGSGIIVNHDGKTWRLDDRVPDVIGAPADDAGLADILAPMTGRVIEILCKPGDEVEGGSVLLTLEAMKMEHRMAAPGPARIAELPLVVGDQVDIGDLLVRFEPSEQA